MGDVQKFESALEREWFDHIEFLCESAPAKDGEPKDDPQMFLEEFVTLAEDHLIVVIDISTPKSELRVYWNDTCVYERSDGYTRIFRPGAWLTEVVERSFSRQMENAMESLPVQIERDKERRAQFAPL